MLGFERKQNSLSFIFKAFNLYNMNLVALSWLNLKTQKGKIHYALFFKDKSKLISSFAGDAWMPIK